MTNLTMRTLPLAALLAFTPMVLANLGQEIAQSSELEVGATIADVDAGDVDDAVDLPIFDDLPGGDDLEADVAQLVLEDEIESGPPTPVTPPAPGMTFSDSRLGQALAQPTDTPDVQIGSKFIIAFWHQVIVDLQQADYSRVTVVNGETVILDPEHPGPCYASRVLAMAHLALYDAFVGVTGDAATYLSYSPSQLPAPVPVEIAPVAAAAAAGNAAALVLGSLYSAENATIAIAASLDSFRLSIMEDFMGAEIPFVDGTDPWPMTVANAIIADRRTDGAGDPDRLAFVPASSFNGGSADVYEHTPDPTAVDPESGDEQFFYAPHWGLTRPFLHSRRSLPGLSSSFGISNIDEGPLATYREDFIEVRDLGRNESDMIMPMNRTQAQSQTGIFWAYDGGLFIGVPPRLYNSISDDIIIELLGSGDASVATGFQLVRLYAMINVALADAGVSAWKDKYFFNFWRPVIGIRRANEDPATADIQDDTWVQFGAPNTNRNRPGVNPAFPAYPSGHATFGTSVMEVVKGIINQPASRTYTMFSDEFDGTAIDDSYCARFNDCDAENRRPFLTKELTIDAAIEQNKQSRIFLGVHWQSDQQAGDMLGTAIAANVVANFPGRV